MLNYYQLFVKNEWHKLECLQQKQSGFESYISAGAILDSSETFYFSVNKGPFLEQLKKAKKGISQQTGCAEWFITA